MTPSETTLLILANVFRAEVLAKNAVDLVMERCTHVSTRLFLDKLSLMHAANQHQLRSICESLQFSPADYFELPERVERLMTRRNVPERLLLAWLNQCEIRLGEMYAEVDGELSSIKEQVDTIAQRQKKLSKELAVVMLDTTTVKDLSMWN